MDKINQLHSVNVLSLGAGVQSTALALMSEKRELPFKFDCAIFADTKREPTHVYDNLNKLVEMVSYPIYIVYGNDVDVDENFHRRLPLYTINPPEKKNRNGMQPRQCTSNYKIKPIQKKIKELYPNQLPVDLSIGFTVDEVSRMKDSRVKYVNHVYPLIDIGLTYEGCQKWIKENYPDMNVKKSACTICPFRRNHMWRELKEEYPELFNEAVEIDNKIRRLHNKSGLNFLHDRRIPLSEIDFRSEGQKGQLFFNNVCEGNCGT